MHEEYTLKIMIEPTNSPCETCSLDCSLQEKQDGICEKLNEFNNKIIAKEYDYDKAVNIAMNAIIEKRKIVDENSDAFAISKEINYCNELAVEALKALLER